MTISVTIDGANAEEIHREMRTLLEGTYPGNSATAIASGVVVANGATAGGKAPSGRTRDKNKADAAPAAQSNISTGEERTDPAADKQDAADEAAETAATKTVDLTHDDVKKLLGEYVRLFGMTAAQEDGAGLIGAEKLSAIPDTQEALAKAILGIAAGIEKNPKKRDMEGEIDPEKVAVLKPIVAAARAVK